MKLFLVFIVCVFSSTFVSANTAMEETQLHQKFSDAARSKDLQKKCAAAQDLMKFYIKTNDKNKAEMARGILKRDCKKSR